MTDHHTADTGAQPVGVLGLGRMGAVLADRLLAGGIEVIGYDPLDANLAAFAARGGRPALSAASVADQAPVVLACLPSAGISLAVAAEVASGRRLRHYIEMSTIGREAMREIEGILSPSGIGLVDAPISGGVRLAAQGKAAVVASGNAASLAAVRPVLAAITESVLIVGPNAGDAQICKLINNAMSFSAFVVSCEALAVGVKAGLDPELLLRYVNAGSGRNSATLDKIPSAILPRTFASGGALAGVVKDLDLYLSVARETGMSDHVVDLVRQHWATAIERFGGDLDASHIVRLFEEVGIQIGGKGIAADGG